MVKCWGIHAELRTGEAGIDTPDLRDKGEVGSSNAEDEVNQWKLCRKLGSSYTFGLTKERLRRTLGTLMNLDGS
jgi:hypothetical protein